MLLWPWGWTLGTDRSLLSPPQAQHPAVPAVLSAATARSCPPDSQGSPSHHLQGDLMPLLLFLLQQLHSHLFTAFPWQLKITLFSYLKMNEADPIAAAPAPFTLKPPDHESVCLLRASVHVSAHFHLALALLLALTAFKGDRRRPSCERHGSFLRLERAATCSSAAPPWHAGPPTGTDCV